MSLDLHSNHPRTVTELEDLIKEIAAQPADSPLGLIGQHYVDPDFFEHERQTILKDGWHCVGRAGEFENQGDFKTLYLLGESLIIARGEDRIRALSNVCRHRGMPLAKGEGNAKRFVCSYHAWAYGLNGGLLRAPRMKNAGFDTKNCKLPEFHCVERFGFIYVCLADHAPDLDANLAELATLLEPYEPEKYRFVHSATEVWKTNWKCLVENFMEGYHLSVVHPQTLHGYTPTGLCKKGPSGPGFTSYHANYPTDIPSRGTGAPRLDEDARHRSTLFATFPGQVTSISPSLLVSLSILPVSPGEIEVRWTMSVYGDDLDDDTIQQRIQLWTEVNEEDRLKLEEQWPALASIHATGGPLASDDYEGTIRDFNAWLARSITNHESSKWTRDPVFDVRGVEGGALS